MFDINLLKKIKKFPKKRIFKKFNIFFLLKKLPYLISLQNYKLSYIHIKTINFFISKKTNTIKKISKKEKYKKVTNTTLKKLFFLKNNFFRNFNSTKENKIVFLKKYKIFTKIILIFQLPKISYTKKNLGIRMGKGKGSIYSWFLNINAGWKLIYFLNWNKILLKYLMHSLKILLPGKNKIII